MFPVLKPGRFADPGGFRPQAIIRGKARNASELRADLETGYAADSGAETA